MSARHARKEPGAGHERERRTRNPQKLEDKQTQCEQQAKRGDDIVFADGSLVWFLV